MPVLTSGTANLRAALAAMDLTHWSYDDATDTLTPVVAGDWPDGFAVEFPTVSNAELKATAGDQLLPNLFSNAAQFVIDEPHTFAFMSYDTNNVNLSGALIVTKFIPAAGSDLTEDGVIVLHSVNETTGVSHHGHAYEAGFAGADDPWAEVSANSFSTFLTNSNTPPPADVAGIGGGPVLSRLLLSHAGRYIGACRHVLQPALTSAVYTNGQVSASTGTYTAFSGSQDFARLIAGATISRAGMRPYDLFIPFDGVVDELE